MANLIDIDRMISRCQDWGNDDAEEAARQMCAEIEQLRAIAEAAALVERSAFLSLGTAGARRVVGEDAFNVMRDALAAWKGGA